MKSQAIARWRLADPAHPGFRLETSPFYWLTRASGRYLLEMERRLKAIGMDVPRWRVLIILAETEPASIGELGERSVVKLPTMTRIVQRMEAAGLVVTAARASDARVTEARMTPAGRAALARVRGEGSAVFGAAFGGIDGGEIDALIALLHRVFDNLGAPPPPRRPRAGDAPVG